MRKANVKKEDMKKASSYIIFGAIIIGVMMLMRNCEDSKQVEINHSMVVQSIEEMGRLEVVKYNVQNMVEYKKMRKWLPNAKTMLMTVGEIVGCIDLAKITANDIIIIGDSVHLMLPAPEICYCKIDHSRSKVFNTDYGWWDSADLVDEAYRYAEGQLYAEAMRMGIEEDSKKSAVKMLSPLLSMLGYTKVGISFKEPEEGENSPMFKFLPSDDEAELQ